MKHNIYLLLMTPMLFLLAGCGSDEPDVQAKPISCLAHYTDNIYGEQTINASFYLFPGTGYASIDPNSFVMLPFQKAVAIKSDGARVESIGWTATSKDRSTIVPSYSTSANQTTIQSGTFTIVCIPASKGRVSAYKMKTITKRVDELIMVDAYFKSSDFDGTYGDWKLIPW